MLASGKLFCPWLAIFLLASGSTANARWFHIGVRKEEHNRSRPFGNSVDAFLSLAKDALIHGAPRRIALEVDERGLISVHDGMGTVVVLRHDGQAVIQFATAVDSKLVKEIIEGRTDLPAPEETAKRLRIATVGSRIKLHNQHGTIAGANVTVMRDPAVVPDHPPWYKLSQFEITRSPVTAAFRSQSFTEVGFQDHQKSVSRQRFINGDELYRFNQVGTEDGTAKPMFGLIKLEPDGQDLLISGQKVLSPRTESRSVEPFSVRELQEALQNIQGIVDIVPEEMEGMLLAPNEAVKALKNM